MRLIIFFYIPANDYNNKMTLLQIYLKPNFL